MIDQSIDTFRENGKALPDTHLIATELRENTHTHVPIQFSKRKRKKKRGNLPIRMSRDKEIAAD